MIEIITRAIVAIFAAILMLPTPAQARPVIDFRCADIVVEVSFDKSKTPPKPVFSHWIVGRDWADDKFKPLPSRLFRHTDGGFLYYRGKKCTEIPYEDIQKIQHLPVLGPPPAPAKAQHVDPPKMEGNVCVNCAPVIGINPRCFTEKCTDPRGPGLKGMSNDPKEVEGWSDPCRRATPAGGELNECYRSLMPPR